MRKNLYKKALQLSMMSLCLSLLSQISQAHNHSHEKHGHSLAAHVHGEANLSIAIDAQIIAVEYNGPAETILGFEHTPKTVEEKSMFETAKSKWERDFQSLIMFTDCQIEQSKFILNTADNHADIEAEAALKCKTIPTTVEIKMLKKFPRIKKLKLDILTTNGKAKTEIVTEEIKTIKL